MNTETIIRLLMLALASFTASPGVLAQGSLTPPGAPAPTMKTLDQVEPRMPISAPITITTPGSYYLTTNVVGGGITIAADNVSLDLMGFFVSGNGSATLGVNVSGSRANIRISNGTVRDFDGYGVDAGSAASVQVENIRAFKNANYGIRTGDKALVFGCQSVSNYVGGFSMGNAGTIKDSVASGNSQFGINVGADCVVLHCNASFNGSNGITSGDGTLISHCTASRNLGLGISVNNGCTVNDCTAHFNHGAGIVAVRSCRISACNVYFGDADGIQVQTECNVLNNDSLNGTGSANAGIRLVGSPVHNRIEGNHVTGNLNKGIDCGLSGNLIIKNTASANPGGNYVNNISNDLGPIGSAATSTSPWANISF